MRQQYIQVMKTKGYEQEWEKEPYIFTRMEGEECYVVLLVEQALSAELLSQKRQWLEKYYSARGSTRVYQLCIICQPDGLFSDELLALAAQASNVWLFAEYENRMYQYEHQPLEFDGLCQSFETSQPEQKMRHMPPITKKNFPYVTLVLVLTNIFCFVFPMMTGQHKEWIDAGGEYWVRILEDGEVYRVWTHMFLHVDLGHLFVNMLSLCLLGYVMELEWGHIKYAVIYLGSGLGSGVISFLVELMRMNYVLAVGASGAIFGLYGALLALTLFQKDKASWISTRWLVFLIALSLYDGFVKTNVSNIGHIGGLLTGFLLMTVIIFAESLFQPLQRSKGNNYS